MAFGTLDLDALAYNGIAVTGLNGPFAFNRQELLFGRDAASWQERNNLRPTSIGQRTRGSSVVMAIHQSPNLRLADSPVAQASYRSSIREAVSNRIDSLGRNTPVPSTNPNAVRSMEGVPPLDYFETDIRARTLSGTIFVSGAESLNGQQKSKYRLRLVDADFQGFLVDLGETNTQAKGRLSVQCDLQGALTNTASLEGTGRAWLREANLYELPAMISLFRLLSVSPGQGAFDSADIQFGIDGDRLPVHEIALDGDIVSMRGSGWVNMRRELHLDLFANVGRRSLVGSLFKAATLWQIEVNGTTSAPQIRRPMPLMNSLGKAQSENMTQP